MCGFEALPYPIIITFVSDSTYMCIFVFGFIVVAGCLVAWSYNRPLAIFGK